MVKESRGYGNLWAMHEFSCILKADVRPLGRADAADVWGRKDSPGQRQKRFLEGRPGADQLRQAGQVLRMHVNGRLTATPQYEAVLVTNSVCRLLLQGDSRPEARGTSLENSSQDTRFGSRRLRTARHARSSGRTHRKFDPVSAAQFLSEFQGVASTS